MTGSLNERDAARNRRKRPAVSRSGGFAENEFINLELDKEQVAALRVWRDDVEDVVNRWTELVEAGYRVNTKYDDYSSSCAAFIIPSDGTDNVGYILTGRGGNAYRALAEAVFKHYQILHGDWRNGSTRSPLERDPDF
jgi:hypothetical protein